MNSGSLFLVLWLTGFCVVLDVVMPGSACAQEPPRREDRFDIQDETTAQEAVLSGRPDVLFIAIDDLNDWVGALGGPYKAKTPNIDALAARGMTFTNAHVPGTSCTPTRTAVLTGMSPFNSGLYSHEIDWRQTPGVRDVATLPRHFRNNGYRTVGAGKIFHAHSYSIRGAVGQQDPNAWDEYFPSLNRQLTDEIYPVDGQSGGPARGGGFNTGLFDFHPLAATDSAMGDGQVASWIVDQLQSDGNGPRFTAVGIYRPHLPWYTPAKYFELYPLDGIAPPPYLANDRDDVAAPRDFNREPGLGYDVMPSLSGSMAGRAKRALQAYLASVSFSDAMVGEVIRGLDQSSRSDNTIIVLWADHGFHLGEKDCWGKFTLWERTTHVPLIVVAPEVTQAGSKCDEAVSLQSVYPTLCDLAGLELPRHVDGQSLRPLLEIPKSRWDEVAITAIEFGSYAVRDDVFRYIVYQDGGEELYDHRIDPHEWNNVVNEPHYSGILRELRQRIPPVKDQTPAPSGD
ncbi:MAG: sulfatase [Planctomycetota bacterium]